LISSLNLVDFFLNTYLTKNILIKFCFCAFYRKKFFSENLVFLHSTDKFIYKILFFYRKTFSESFRKILENSFYFFICFGFYKKILSIFSEKKYF